MVGGTVSHDPHRHRPHRAAQSARQGDGLTARRHGTHHRRPQSAPQAHRAPRGFSAYISAYGSRKVLQSATERHRAHHRAAERGTLPTMHRPAHRAADSTTGPHRHARQTARHTARTAEECARRPAGEKGRGVTRGRRRIEKGPPGPQILPRSDTIRGRQRDRITRPRGRNRRRLPKRAARRSARNFA